MYVSPNFTAYLFTSYADIEQCVWSINAIICDDELEACLEAET